MSDWDAFAEFMQQVEAEKNGLELRSHQECFFRGLRDSGFSLLPSLYRNCDRSWDHYWQLERRLFFEFRTRARQLYDVENSGWDVLFHMQHHGVPTRLLDWTTVFGVALYFALLDKPRHDLLATSVHLSWPYSIGLGLTSNGAA
jgi:hypothetical protein